MIGLTDVAESSAVAQSPMDPLDGVTAVTTELRLVEHEPIAQRARLSKEF